MKGLIHPHELPDYRRWIAEKLRKSTPAEIPSLETFKAIVAPLGTAPGSREEKGAKKCAGQLSRPSRPRSNSSASGKRVRTVGVPEPSAPVEEGLQRPKTTTTTATGELGNRAGPSPRQPSTFTEPASGPHPLQQHAAGQAVSGDTTAVDWPRIGSGSGHINWEQALSFDSGFDSGFDSVDIASLSLDNWWSNQQQQQQQQVHTMEPPEVAETLELWRFGGPTRALKLPAKRNSSLEYTSVPAHMLTDMGFGLASTDLERQFVPLPPPGDDNIPLSETDPPATYFVHGLRVFPVEGGLPIEIDALVYPFRRQFDADWHHPCINMGSQLIKLLEEYPRLSISRNSQP